MTALPGLVASLSTFSCSETFLPGSQPADIKTCVHKSRSSIPSYCLLNPASWSDRCTWYSDRSARIPCRGKLVGIERRGEDLPSCGCRGKSPPGSQCVCSEGCQEEVKAGPAMSWKWGSLVLLLCRLSRDQEILQAEKHCSTTTRRDDWITQGYEAWILPVEVQTCD